MKNMKKCRLFKKCLAVTLSACMVLTMAVPAFATTKTYSGSGEETINYLVIGDSMSNGYCLDGFSFDDAGCDGAPSGIYSELFSQYLQKQGYTVNLSQYAMNGMRSQDLRYILDSTFERDSYGGNLSESIINNVRDEYVKAVEDADIISLGLSMNDLGVFTAFRIKELVYPEGTSAYEGIEISNIINEKRSADFDKYKEMILSYLKSALGSDYEKIVDSVIDPLVDSMVYGLLSFMDNFSEDMDILREKNPDATIIVLGTMNSLEGKKMTFEVDGRDVVIDIGKLYSFYTGIADTYMQADIAASGDVNSLYVEMPSFGILLDELAEYNKDKVDFSDPVEDGLLESVVDTFGGAINSMAGGGFTEDNVTAAVTAYLSGQLTPSNENANAILIAQIYLGIRDAVIDVASMNSIDGSDMIGALSDVNTALSNVAADIMGDSSDINQLATSVLINEAQGKQILRENVEKALEKDGISDALFVFDLCIANNGMGAHPSADGHEAMGDRLIDAYKSFQTSKRLQGNVSETVSSLTGNLIDSFYGVLKRVSESTSKDTEEGETDSSLTSALTNLISGGITGTATLFSKLLDEYVNSANKGAEDSVEADLSEYTLSFDTNGGSLISAVKGIQDSSVDLSTFIPTREGYTFEGWYSDSDLTQKVVTAILTDTKTLYAKWTEIKKDIQDNPSDLEENPFGDVDSDDYFYQPVLWAVNKGITTGTSETTFSPEDSCTRAQAVTFLWRAAGKPSAGTSALKFSDVKPTDYYAEAVAWAVEKGITTGTSATTFSPNNPCTRGQIVTFLYRAEGSPSVSGQIPFADVSASDYFAKPVIWAVSEDITKGTSSTAFSPANPCTRGQIVTFLYRAA